MTDQNKTHGVLTDKAAQLIPLLQPFLDRLSNDDRSGLMFEADGDTLRETIVLLRTINRAPQSPVAPAAYLTPIAARIAKIESEPGGKQRMIDARARLADVPTVSATVPVAWAATDEDGNVESLGFNQSRRFDTPLYAYPYTATPTPPTSAADAARWQWLRNAKGVHFDNLSIRLPEQMDAYADAAIAANGKGQP